MGMTPAAQLRCDKRSNWRSSSRNGSKRMSMARVPPVCSGSRFRRYFAPGPTLMQQESCSLSAQLAARLDSKGSHACEEGGQGWEAVPEAGGGRLARTPLHG